MAVSLNVVPAPLQPRVGPDAPAQMRMMIARAVVPIPPADLFAALSYLASNEHGELADTARKSLIDLPRGVVEGVLTDCHDGDLLDFSLREYVEDDGLAQMILLNADTPDDSVAWAARRVRGALVEVISNNQARIMRHPSIVEGIYYNPEAPMAVVNRVFETAVRSGLNLRHIPGFKEIYESIFGQDAAAKVEEAEQDPKGLDDKKLAELVESLPDELPAEEEGAGLDDDAYMEAMREAAKPEDPEKPAEEESGRIGKKPMHALIEDMSVPQKIRLALVGNKTARAVLIKDSKILVALSVLKSPQISDGEIANFCKNKALSDRVIQVIARNREWTRSTATQMSLIKHPKTPASFTNRWVRALAIRDLKEISKSRDVPGHVARLAKNIISQRQSGKKG
ncbi:MAG: hypothetical protein ACI9OJ_000623 [Myxococcota bacterium]|jgi:hypothetical protein